MTITKMTRTYDRSLREAQAQQTRAAIIDAAFALIGDDGEGQLSFARVAERAGVSEPTVYRNFPNREALIEAISARVNERYRAPQVPDEVEDLPAAAIATAEYFGENGQIVRAALHTGVAREVREHGRRGRAAKIRTLLDGPTEHLDKKDAEAIQAVFATFLRGETWIELADRHHIDTERAGNAVAWAVRAMLDALRRDRNKGTTTLADEKLRTRAARLREKKKGREE